MAGMSIGIDGVDEFKAALQTIGDSVALRTIKQASEKGCIPIRNQAKMECPRDTGTLAENIRIRKKVQRKKGFAGAEVIVGNGWYKGATFYGAFIEFGHKTVSGSIVPPNPFVTRSYEAQKHSALSLVSDYVNNGIKEAAAKVHVKQMKEFGYKPA